MVQYSNGNVTMKSMTFYIALFSTLVSLAFGAYGASKVYTDNKVETVNARVDGVQELLNEKVDNLDDKLCAMSETLREIKMEIKDLRK